MHHGFNQLKYFKGLLSLCVRTKPYAYIFGETDHSLIVVIKTLNTYEKNVCAKHITLLMRRKTNVMEKHVRDIQYS